MVELKTILNSALRGLGEESDWEGLSVPALGLSDARATVSITVRPRRGRIVVDLPSEPSGFSGRDRAGR